jgi:hypothetical protein
VRRRYAEEEAARLVGAGLVGLAVARVAHAIPILAKGGVAALEDFAAGR